MWWSINEFYRSKTVSLVLLLLTRFDSHAAALAGGKSLVTKRNSAIKVLLDLSALKLEHVGNYRSCRKGYGGSLELRAYE